jgi:hypothetical protein
MFILFFIIYFDMKCVKKEHFILEICLIYGILFLFFNCGLEHDTIFFLTCEENYLEWS